jgi:hypothetical protein
MQQDRIHKLFQAIDAMNPDGFVSFLTEDAEFRFGSYPSVHGRAGIFATVDGFWKTIAGSQHALVRHWVDGNQVAVQGLVTYTRKDGRVVDVPFVNVFEMRGDLIHRYLIHIDNTPVFAP